MANCRCRLWCSSYPAATPAFTSCGSLERINSSAGLATTLPAKRTTRSRSCWASAIWQPIVDRLARTGNDRAIALPTTRLTHADRNAPHLKGDLDFSFSGLKTAVLRHVNAKKDAGHELSESETADICATFQRVVVAALIDRTFDAARRFGAASIGVAGGVSANSRLREELRVHGEAREMPTFVPSLSLSTDNAAMIAAAGLRRFRAGVVAPADLNAHASLPLS